MSLDFRAYDRKFRPELCHRLAICDADLEKIRPCTKTQSGMLAAFQKSNGSLYFNSIEIELLDDSQSLRRLQKAWNHVTAKYEMLRTGFALVDDSNHPFAMLTYTKGSSYFDHDLLQELALHSLDSLSERTSTVSNIVLHSLHLPPWRVEAVRRGNTFAIMMHIHHAMFDAYSLRLILDDFVKSSQGIKLSAEIPIDLLLQPILIESDSNLDDKKNFWHEYTKDISVTKFPSTTVLQVQSSKTYSLQKRCTMALQKIHSRCQDLGVTIYAVCQVSWARILCIYTGETSVIFGSGLL